MNNINNNIPRETWEGREWLLALLKKNVLTVTFTKVNGEERSMPCTLDPMLLPVVTEIKEVVKKEKSETVISAWCTDKSAWRSFRLDSIKKLELNV